MRNLLYYFVFIFVLVGCQAEKKEPKWVYQDSPISNSQNEQAHRIIGQYELGRLFLFERGDKTWQDVDAFYRKERDKHPQNPIVGRILLHKIIHFLVENYGLIRDDSEKAKKVSAYYLEEYRTVEGENPKIYYSLLNHVKEDWERAKINDYRDYAIERSVYFKKGLHTLIRLKSEKDAKIGKGIAKTLIEANRKALVETDEYVQKLNKI